MKTTRDWSFSKKRLVDAAAAVKATATASRNRNIFFVPDEIRDMASEAAQCRNPVRKKELRKIALKARREFEAGTAVLTRGKVIQRPVVTKLWVNGCANEDGDEGAEDVRAHCERCHNDKAKTSEVQAERIRRRRVSGDRRVNPPGTSDTDHSGQGSPSTRGNDAEQGQRACQLLGNGDAAVFADGNRIRGAYWFDKRLKGERLKMIHLTWAQNGCFPVVVTIHTVTRYVHCRSCPIVVSCRA